MTFPLITHRSSLTKRYLRNTRVSSNWSQKYIRYKHDYYHNTLQSTCIKKNRANSYNSKSIVNKITDYVVYVKNTEESPFWVGYHIVKYQRVLGQSGLRPRGLIGINYLCHMQFVICRWNKHIRLLLDFNSKYSEYSC